MTNRPNAGTLRYVVQKHGIISDWRGVGGDIGAPKCRCSYMGAAQSSSHTTRQGRNRARSMDEVILNAGARSAPTHHARLMTITCVS